MAIFSCVLSKQSEGRQGSRGVLERQGKNTVHGGHTVCSREQAGVGAKTKPSS